MKTPNLTVIILAACVLTTRATPVVYFGEDLNPSQQIGEQPDNPARLTNYPFSTLAANRFYSRLTGVATEHFESYAPGTGPHTLTFGPDTATLSGASTIYDVPTNTSNGTYPTSGNRFLQLVSGSPGFFAIDFSTAQAAFGFFATDIEEAQLQVILVTQGGVRTTQTLASTLPQASGGVTFFGVIDTESPFVRVEFSRIGNQEDGFGFDDMTIGRVEQVHSEPASLDIGLYAGVGITGTVGATYRIEYSVMLPSTNWTALTNIVLPSSPYLYFDTQSVTNHGQRYYRALTLE